MNIYKANAYRVWLNSPKIISIVFLFFAVILYLFYYQSLQDGAVLYQIYMTAVTFFWIMYFILQNGELFEKNIIRYYAESETNRYKIILSFYLEDIILYVMSVLLLLAFFWSQGIGISSRTILLYFLLYILYLAIAMNALLTLKKTSAALLTCIVLLWLFPNLINYLFEDTIFYQLQLGFYLSPDTFVGSQLQLQNWLIYGVYTFFFFLMSIVIFEKAEL